MRFVAPRSAILCLPILMLFAACESKEKKPKARLDTNIPAMTFVDVASQYSQDAFVRVKVKAPLQYQYQNRNESYPEGIYVEFFDTLGVVTTTIVADSGFHNVIENSYRAVGNVVVINLEEQQQLETEILNWDIRKEIIYTDTLTPVKITTRDEIINANGLRATQDFREYDITGGITGVFTLKEGSGPGTRADPASSLPAATVAPEQESVPRKAASDTSRRRLAPLAEP